MRAHWRERHRDQMAALRELVRQAHAYVEHREGQVGGLTSAALDYAEAVRRLAGTERSR